MTPLTVAESLETVAIYLNDVTPREERHVLRSALKRANAALADGNVGPAILMVRMHADSVRRAWGITL